MADLETRVDKLEQNQNELKTSIEVWAARIDAVMTDMRDRDNQRAAELREIRELREKDNAKHDAEIKELNKKIDDKIDKIEEKIDKLYDRMQTTAIATIFGVGAIVWAAVSALK